MIYDLVVTWKNPQNGKWTPVGKLSYKNSKYYFEYTPLAVKALKTGDFEPFHSMPDSSIIYESKSLFAVFQNRLLEKSRPEYSAYYDWLNLSEGSSSPLDELARSGGIRATDNFQLFIVPSKSLGKYTILFFSHGIRHLAKSYIPRLEKLKRKSPLFLMKDCQNIFDPNALAIRTEDPPELVGYVPRFLTHDFNTLLEKNDTIKATITVEKINLAAPMQYRLLCKFTAPWPENFTPFDGLTRNL